MQETNKRKKVLCPVESNGKTSWKMLGNAWVNQDNSINIYLDSLPLNGKLHLRDWDEPPREKRGQQQFGLHAVAGGAPAASAGEEIPF